MTPIREDALAPGAGWFGQVAAGQTLRVTAKSVIELIAYDSSDASQWFDTARTRVYNLNIYPTAGHRLFSKANNPMMRIAADGLAGIGRHDLQSGNACVGTMLEVVAPLGIRTEDLPDPLGLFRNLHIDQATGHITPAPIAPDRPVSVDILAEIDVTCALVNCPDPATSAPGAEAIVSVLAG